MNNWRNDLFEGLPTELARTVDKHIDDSLAVRIAEIEPMAVKQEEVKKFLEIMRAPAAPGVFLFLWKRIPCLKVTRKGVAVRVDELRGVGKKPGG